MLVRILKVIICSTTKGLKKYDPITAEKLSVLFIYFSEIHTEVDHTEAIIGSTVSVTCQVISEDAPTNCSWLKNNVEVRIKDVVTFL